MLSALTEQAWNAMLAAKGMRFSLDAMLVRSLSVEIPLSWGNKGRTRCICRPFLYQPVGDTVFVLAWKSLLQLFCKSSISLPLTEVLGQRRRTLFLIFLHRFGVASSQTSAAWCVGALRLAVSQCYLAGLFGLELAYPAPHGAFCERYVPAYLADA